MKLNFDADTHTYARPDTGAVVPGVSHILRELGISQVGQIDPWYLERGKAVHEACYLWEIGQLDEDSVDGIIRPYLEGFKAWYSEVGPELVLAEESVWHEEMNYAGTPDRIYRIGQREYVVDLKSGDRPARSYALQLSLYGHAGPNGHSRARVPWPALLMLPGDGTARWIDHDTPRQRVFGPKDDAVAFSAVRLYHWMRNGKD